MFGKWPLNSVHGHILVYSTTRRASWRHAKCAARLLIDSVGQQSAAGGDSERESMAKSILLVSIVKEPSEFFTNNVCFASFLHVCYHQNY